MNPRRHFHLLSLLLAALLGWPWSVALATMEVATETAEADANAGPVRMSRLPRSARHDSPAMQPLRIAETDDEDGDGPGRTPVPFYDPAGPRSIEAMIVGDQPQVDCPCPQSPSLLQSQRRRC
ncbi:MAG: hypothetical protein JWN86_1278 [Planctomycetota bacterium]|nr:hypothetical protein [Planctomycetota bacterium]